MSSFRDLARHFGALPPETVASLTSIAQARGMGAGIIEPLGTGRGARWRRLQR